MLKNALNSFAKMRSPMAPTHVCHLPSAFDRGFKKHVAGCLVQFHRRTSTSQWSLPLTGERSGGEGWGEGGQ